MTQSKYDVIAMSIGTGLIVLFLWLMTKAIDYFYPTGTW